jgi:hypothetical protein
MRLLFLCTSLEPGRDGVGDYARRLAHECSAQGHACALLALNDRHIDRPVESTEENGTAVLRLPSLSDGLPRAVAFREKFAPDWISLQLVAYGLHPKGLLFAARTPLREIVGDARLHLMLHELWLGNDAVPAWRHRVMGFLQSTSLRRLIATLHPALVATTNPVYAAQARTIGVEAEVLPLCGNIPIEPDGAALPEPIAAFLESGKTWLGLFFGGLYRQWKPEPFFGQLARAAQATGRSVGLVQVGNAGGEGEKIWAELERDYAATFRFFTLGPQSAPAVSALMLAADFGVAASPWSVIGKSGSAAAMLDHGLPVIVTRDDFQPRIRATQPPTTDPLVHRADDTLETKLIAGLPRRVPQARAPGIAAKLLRDMTAISAARP